MFRYTCSDENTKPAVDYAQVQSGRAAIDAAQNAKIKADLARATAACPEAFESGDLMAMVAAFEAVGL